LAKFLPTFLLPPFGLVPLSHGRGGSHESPMDKNGRTQKKKENQRRRTEARKRKKKTNAGGFRNRRRNVKELGKAAVRARLSNWSWTKILCPEFLPLY